MCLSSYEYKNPQVLGTTKTLILINGWVHTCNVTAYRNAVTLQVTDTVRSYYMKFHPVSHGVTVLCESYTMGFQFVTGTGSIMNVKKARGADGGDVSR
jgi:hypothetical protein